MDRALLDGVVQASRRIPTLLFRVIAFRDRLRVSPFTPVPGDLDFLRDAIHSVGVVELAGYRAKLKDLRGRIAAALPPAPVTADGR